MSEQVMQQTERQPLAWILVGLLLIGLTVPAAAKAGHRDDGLVFILGAALGYAIHDAHSRDRHLYYHAGRHHRGWHDCRRRSHYEVARYYDQRHHAKRYRDYHHDYGYRHRRYARYYRRDHHHRRHH